MHVHMFFMLAPVLHAPSFPLRSSLRLFIISFQIHLVFRPFLIQGPSSEAFDLKNEDE